MYDDVRRHHHEDEDALPTNHLFPIPIHSISVRTYERVSPHLYTPPHPTPPCMPCMGDPLIHQPARQAGWSMCVYVCVCLSYPSMKLLPRMSSGSGEGTLFAEKAKPEAAAGKQGTAGKGSRNEGRRVPIGRGEGGGGR
eukprot:GHVU01106001.1.p1 GENE.GHVU01106001.1~~GHVU01106001.1.p1  ORF type:complete len:148 (-),score=18.86 GHVU01106001.1:449-865(-)